MLYQINKGTKNFGANTIFEDIQFEIKNNEKIAVVGRNGCGKSTLLKVMINELELESGTIHKMNNCTIGYLAQTTFYDESKSVEEELLSIYEELHQLKAKLDATAKRMETEYSDEILELYADLQQNFESQNGYTYQQEMMTVFTKFGFQEEDLSRIIDTFSGGQKTRLAFVKLLLSKPDILLLDEPTNHLDLKTIEWLEGYLKHYDKAIVLVSHDRVFLDEIAEVIYEIEFGTMKKYIGNYSSFVSQKENDRERQLLAYNRQQKDIDRLETLIEKFRYKATKASFAQSKIKFLDRMEKIDAPDKENSKKFNAHFVARLKGGKTVLETEGLVIGYDDPLCTIDLKIMQGQKIAVLGGNGEGKSTFVKTLMEKVPALSGSYLMGHQIEPGYFDQELAQFSSGKTVLEEIWDDYPQYDRTEIRTVLGRFLFSSDDVFKTVDVLSGGEKVRLSLAKLMLKQANFLILDEPTNHLDILGKEALEEALNGYLGTLLVVSHDRYFIKKVSTSILLIEEGKATYYPMSYDEYMGKVQVIPKKEVKSEQKESIPENKKKIVSNNAKEITKLEKLIEEKEVTLNAFREKRFDPDYYHDYKKMQELDETIDGIHNEINQAMSRWEELQE